MFRWERAKQFASFDALKGLQEELRKREEKFLVMQKRELTEEEERELNIAIVKCQKGDTVKITHYYRQRYVEVEGILTAKNLAYKYVQIGQVKIYFDDIQRLEVIKSE